MKILGLIPARGGSKGVPQKNKKMLGNLPLISYTINSAKKSKLVHSILVSTDCVDLFQIAENLGCKPPFFRPSALSQDSSTSIEVVQHAIQFFEEQGILYDAVCLLQPTSPFRKEGFIDTAIQQFIDKQVDSLISVLPVPHEYNPHWTFEIQENGLLKIATGEEHIIPRRQDLPKAYHRDGSIYITKVSVLKQGSFYGDSMAYIESDPEWYVNIDTTTDWIKAEELRIKLEL
jgi:CMP-N,N'-diacetyllegionaminic acid synthase